MATWGIAALDIYIFIYLRVCGCIRHVRHLHHEACDRLRLLGHRGALYGYDYLANAAHLAADPSNSTNINVCTTDQFTKSVNALVYHINPDNKEINIVYPNMLFDRNISDVSSAGLGFGGCGPYILELMSAAMAAVVRPEDLTGKKSPATELVNEFRSTYMLILTVGLNVRGKSKAGAFYIDASLTSMIYALGDVSGAHFNPAVTVAFLASSRCSDLTPAKAGTFLGTQIAGGIAAAFTYAFIRKGETFALEPVGESTWAGLYVAEIVYTFVPGYAVLSATASERTKASHLFGLAIGSCVTVGGLAIGGIPGGSLNALLHHSIGYLPDGTDISMAGNGVNHSASTKPDSRPPSSDEAGKGFFVDETAINQAGNTENHGPVHHQKDAYPELESGNEIGYFSDDTAYNLAGKALSNPESIQLDRHTPGPALPAAELHNTIVYPPDGTAINIAGNEATHPEYMKPNSRTPGSPLHVARYRADTAYFVDGTAIDEARNELSYFNLSAGSTLCLGPSATTALPEGCLPRAGFRQRRRLLP